MRRQNEESQAREELESGSLDRWNGDQLSFYFIRDFNFTFYFLIFIFQLFFFIYILKSVFLNSTAMKSALNNWENCWSPVFCPQFRVCFHLYNWRLKLWKSCFFSFLFFTQQLVLIRYFSSGAACKPFPSCFLRLSQNEPWCVTFRMEVSSICNIMNEQVKLISINMKTRFERR